MVKTYYDYNFRLENGKFLGEKLCCSHKHAENKRIEFEKKYNCKVEKIFYKKIIKNNGKVICGF